MKKWIKNLNEEEIGKLIKGAKSFMKPSVKIRNSIFSLIRKNYDLKSVKNHYNFEFYKFLKPAFLFLILIFVAASFFMYYLKGFSNDKINLIIAESYGNKEIKFIRNFKAVDISAVKSLNKSDVIKTGIGSECILLLENNINICLLENTEIKIKKLFVNNRLKFNAKLNKGKLIVQVGKLSNEYSFNIQTDEIILKVIGTEFMLEKKHNATTFAVNEGIVEIINKKSGKVFELKAGMTVTIENINNIFDKISLNIKEDFENFRLKLLDVYKKIKSDFIEDDESKFISDEHKAVIKMKHNEIADTFKINEKSKSDKNEQADNNILNNIIENDKTINLMKNYKYFSKNAYEPYTDDFDVIISFSEPIINSINNEKPSYTDDFTTNKGWNYDIMGLYSNKLGIRNIENGKLTLYAGGKKGWSDISNPDIFYKNYVLKVDARLENAAAWGKILFFYNTKPHENGNYAYDHFTIEILESNINFLSQVYPRKTIYNNSKNFAEEKVSIMLIIYDNDISVYINGKPVWFHQNKRISKGSYISFIGNIRNDSLVPVVSFKNLEIWDLDHY